MNPLTPVLADNLVDAIVLNDEAPTESREEAVTTGAVFAIVRLTHEMNLFNEVTYAAALKLGRSVPELQAILPDDLLVADAAELYSSIS